ncbi:hypothetical protein N0V85_009014 [Neurospora sp. IMI 360204]|nr:hypothetical protein N0V85_009014 [Neurospora sp. IMI 360204]
MFRSASGPAGLSINTGTANLFGSTPAQSTGTGFGTASAQQPQNTGSLFGAPTPASGGLFGGGGTTSQQQQQQQQIPSLFGQPAQQPQQQQSTGGIFGQPQQQQQQQQTSGGIFGQPAQQQQTSGGIFGQPAQQQQQQQQQQPQQQQMSLFGSGTTTTPAATGGGLFGGGATTQQPAQSTGTSLFAQPAQQTGTTSLFGAAQPAQQTTGTTSLFGQPQQQQQQQQQQPQQQQTSLFGGTGGTSLFGTRPATTTGTTSLFGTAQPSTTTTQPASTGLSLSMGQSQNTTAAQNAAAGSKVDLPALRSTTRFSDLTDSLQSQLTQIDESIQKCISDCSAINAFMPGHEQQLSSIPLDVSFVSRKSEGAAGALNSDVQAIASLKETVKKDAANARLSFKSIDQLRLPGGYWQAGLWSSASRSGQQTETNGAAKTSATKSGNASKTGQQEEEEADAESNQDLIGYFSKTADEMDEMMKRFERNLGEIEVHLHGVQGNVLEQLQRAAGQKQLVQETANGSEGQVDQRVVELAGVLRDFEESILKVAGVVGGVKEGITELQLRDFMGNGS